MIPIPIDTNRTVAAFEFRPGNRKVVHHALLYLDNTGSAAPDRRIRGRPRLHQLRRPRHLADRRPRRMGPGAMPRMLPDGMGKFLRKGSDLVLQVHYHPDGKPETDQSVVGIYFTKKPAEKIVERDRRPDAATSTSRPAKPRITPPPRARRCRWTFRRSGSRRTCTISARK